MFSRSKVAVLTKRVDALERDVMELREATKLRYSEYTYGMYSGPRPAIALNTAVQLLLNHHGLEVEPRPDVGPMFTLSPKATP